MRIGSAFGSGLAFGSGAARRALGLVAIVMAVCGCQPKSDLHCADGDSCADGQRCVVTAADDRGMCMPACASSPSCTAATPVCDLAQGACRACFPGEDAVCRLRDPQRPRCGGGQCVQCVAKGPGAAQATECQAAGRGLLGSTPVCDPLHNTCRACQRHSECDSGVCAKDTSGETYGVPLGSCVPAEQVLIVDQDLCKSDGPVYCTVKQALDRIDGQHRYVLLRKSAVAGDFTDLQIGYLPSHTQYPLSLIGPLADAAPTSGSSPLRVTLGGVLTKDALTITSNSRVVVEGLAILGSKTGLACVGVKAQVRVVRTMFAGNNTALLADSGCTLRVEESWFGRGPDGSLFSGSLKNARSLDVTASDFWVLNSVFADNGDSRKDAFGGVRVHSLGSGRTRSGIINSTFMQQSGLVWLGKYVTSVLCDTPVGDRLVVMNTLLFTDAPLSTLPEEHYIDSNCGASLHHNGSNDPALTDNDQSLVLPATATPFIAAAARNLHLGPKIAIGARSLQDGGAAAIDLASDRILAPGTDIEGTLRNLPSGPISIGAYSP